MKKCKVCKTEFQPQKMGQKVCSPECAISLAVSDRGKALKVEQVKERRADAVKRDSLKRRADWLKEAQTAFNAFVRARDAQTLCICCNQPLSAGDVGGSYDCGHYRSVGSAPHLRFDERNAHAQRKQCNRWGAGRAVDYRIGLIQRIGLAAVERIEADQAPRKWSIDELKAIKAEYSRKAKELKR